MNTQQRDAAIKTLEGDIKHLSGTMQRLHLQQALTPERQEYYANNISVLKGAIETIKNNLPVS